ncbi:ABC transporter substrate-binding protein [Labrys portucalensis]|uniref:ABC transporter substrate-binding protein n=1 Tax=Labrys neptuniae TaxID=376174 RepID=A0ABV6ZMX2_9HYPH|nr:ABC transporter substrate-binding protein [Labrys neptuniae]MDT3378565.1 ABC transporter substrate-binding protein [Labrys neptuniae]
MKGLSLLAATVAILAATSAFADNKLNLKTEGELRVLINPIYPPMEFVNQKSGVQDGFDVDLANAIGKKLGLEIIFINSAFAELQSGLQTGRGDVIISGMSDNPKRQEVMDFVDYITSGPIFFTTKANADKYKTSTDLCGQKIAGSRTGTFPDNVKAWSESNCVGKGKPAVQFDGTADSNAARLGMRQGRYDAVVQGVETIAYQMSVEPDTYVMVGEPILTNDVFGMGFKKSNTALRDAVAQTLDGLIKDGTYADLLKKWGLNHNAVEKAVINGVK